MEVTTTTSPDDIIKNLGGCGLYQWRITIVAHLMKFLYCWSLTALIIFLYTPPWKCNDVNVTNRTFNIDTSVTVNSLDVWSNDNNITSDSTATISDNNSSTEALSKSCVIHKGTKCMDFKFEGSSTLVSEFNLVCDESYVPSLMVSVQSAGALFGSMVAGQLSDLFGRKRPFFGAIALIAIFNLAGLFTPNWQLFAATRFFIGIGGSAFMTAKYSLLSEFSMAQHRAWIIGFPSWPIEVIVFAGVAYMLGDWTKVQIAVTAISIPCLMTWWIMPESFRWFLAHNRAEDAEKVLRKVAVVNKKPCLTLKQVEEIDMVKGQEKGDRKYTFIDIFRSKYLVKLTLLMAFVWLALGFVSSGILFGIQALSGNLYMNTFLFALSGIPAKAIAAWFENVIGRRNTAIVCYLVTALGGFGAGIVQYIDTPNRGALTNGFAILANVGIATAWGPVQTMTIELYPTVIRSIGFGLLGTVGRFGSIIAPQFVFLSTKIPGIMFLGCGVLSTLCICALFGLAETKNANLNDKLVEAKAVK